MNPAKPGVAKIQLKNSSKALTEDLIVQQISQGERKRQRRDLEKAQQQQQQQTLETRAEAKQSNIRQQHMPKWMQNMQPSKQADPCEPVVSAEAGSRARIGGLWFMLGLRRRQAPWRRSS